MSFNAEGLVVKETSYGDNDKILTVLVRGKGKMQLWARGCKRMKSPLLSVAHTFTYAQFSVAESKGSYSIRSAQLIDNFYLLRENLDKLALAEYVAELASRCVMDNDESDGVLTLVLNTLYLLSNTEKRIDLIKACYEMRLMCETGYLPVLDGCTLCGTTEGRLFFCPDHGGIVCEKCSNGTEVNVALIKALAHICYAECKSVFSFSLGDGNMKKLSYICEKYLIYHLGFEPKTLSFYKTVTEVK